MVDAFPGSQAEQQLPGTTSLEEEDQSGHVVKIKLPYGYARALLLGDVWHYAACDALSAAGSRKTYTSNKVCLWKQKPENLAAFGTTGKIIKLDRQSVYCLRLDGITKLLKDKGLGSFMQFFEHHEDINPPNSQYEMQEGRALAHAKKQHSIQYVESPEEQEAHFDQHQPQPPVSHSSHAWTVFNPVNGTLLHAAMCASCGVQDMRPAASLQCPLAGADPTPVPRAVAVMQRQFQTLMEEMQAHFIQMEDQFKELTTQLRSHFSAVQQQFGALMAEHQRRKAKLQRTQLQAYLEEAKRPRKRPSPEEKGQNGDRHPGEQQDPKGKEGNDQHAATTNSSSEQAAKRRCDEGHARQTSLRDF